MFSMSWKTSREKLTRFHPLFLVQLFQAAGKVEERVGNYTAARRLYGESLQLEPSAATLVAYAMLEFRHPTNGTVDLPRVRRLFEEALLLDPRHGPAYNAYGTIELQCGKIEQARAVFERGLQADCSDAGSLYHGYGKLELTLGNVDAARSILQKGLEQVRAKELSSDSTHRERAKFLSHTLGMIELNSKRPAIARDIFQDGVQRCGNSSRLLLGAALSELRLGKEDAARELFERSIMIDRKHAQAWQAWGVMETKAGNFKTASKLFQCGIQSVPSHGALWHGYASLEIKKDNISNARFLYAAGLQKAPNHIPLYQGWSLLELREGNFQDAKKLITEALTRNKRNGSGWLIAAQIEKEQGNDGLVGLILRRGIECAPNDPELYRKLGEHLVSRGKYNDAREVFEKGMEFNPLHAPLYHSLAELEARVFNLEGLSKLNKRAAALFNSNVMDPPTSSSQAYATRIQAKRAYGLTSDIKALAEKIVDDDEERVLLGNLDNINPSKALESMTGSLLEDEFVGGMISLDYDKKPERDGRP
jgi:tetratricopeptide (TPR) repeat protein